MATMMANLLCINSRLKGNAMNAYEWITTLLVPVTGVVS